MCNELLHMALLPLGLRLPLLLCPAEVYKTAVPHFFKVCANTLRPNCSVLGILCVSSNEKGKKREGKKEYYSFLPSLFLLHINAPHANN